MVKYLHSLLFIFLFSFLYAETSSVIPTDIIKKGTKLVYDVNYYGSNYEFIIIVKNNTDAYAFDWEMSGPENKKGSLNISQDAIENATGIFNQFTEGNINLSDQCCIILSSKMFNALKNNGSMEINIDKKKDIVAVFGNSYVHTQTFGYKNNFSKEFDCITVNDANYYQITFVNDANFPLIVEMKLDWTIKLKSILN